MFKFHVETDFYQWYITLSLDLTLIDYVIELGKLFFLFYITL